MIEGSPAGRALSVEAAASAREGRRERHDVLGSITYRGNDDACDGEPIKEVGTKPSFTNGIRSLSAADALDVNRSFGIQGMSMWESAEIRV